MFIALIPSLKFGLTLGDETNNFNGSGPCVLDQRAVLNFYV